MRPIGPALVSLTVVLVGGACADASDDVAIVATEPAESTEPAPATTEAATTTSTPSPTTTGLPPAEECWTVEDFEVDDATWTVVNDGVMGGRSDGRFVIEDSLMRFDGTVVTAGGGFTSVRLRLAGDELAGSERIEVRARTDGRVYGLTLEDDSEVQGRRVSHRADLDLAGVADADGFVVASLAYGELTPSIFGRRVEAPGFDPGAAREVGIIIADGVDGPFALDVDRIDACA